MKRFKRFQQFINKFVDNPRNLFILFVFVNFIPTIGLLFTEPMDLWGKLVLVLFPLGLYGLLFTLSKNIGLIQLLLFPLLFFHAFQIVVFYLFGGDVLSADMFLNVVTTSVAEAGEVLDSLLPAVFFVIIIYLPTTILAYIALKRKVYVERMARRKIFYTGVLLILISYGLSFMAINQDTKRFQYVEDVYPVNLLYNLDFAIDRWKLSQNYYKTSSDFTFNAKKTNKVDQREIYVLLIGETSRPDNWSLYGYERETTPRLATDTNLVVFKDAITQSNTTHKSVPIIMSAASAEEYDILYKQKSIIEAFNEVGFSTVFISNQASNRTFTDFFGQEADIHHYYRFFDQPTNEFDEILVDKMQHYIDSIPGDIFFVMHTYGSHFNYSERYPKEFSRYQPDHVVNINRREREVMLNAYDNTILYTDYIIDRVTEVLESSGACASMFYCSDHGEDLFDDDRGRFLHASPTPTYYQLRIPFLLWFSPTYKELFPQKVANAKDHVEMPVATNLAFHTILDMAGIDADNASRHLSLVNDGFKPSPRMYLDDHYNPISYYTAGLKKQDREMIKKRNMHF